MPKKKDIKVMFDSISKDYDKLNHILSLEMDKLWRQRSISRIVNRNGDVSVLDIACGTGDFSIAIAKAILKNKSRNKRASSSGHVTAVDISDGMLQVMERKVASEHLEETITIEKGDGENLRFPDDSFDRVTMAFGIRNFENKEKGLKEMLRVLRPEGKLVILDLSLPDNRWMRFLFNLYFLNVIPLIGGFLSGDLAAYKYLPASVRGFPKKKEFMELMASCGFRRVRHKSFTFGVCRMYIGEK